MDSDYLFGNCSQRPFAQRSARESFAEFENAILTRESKCDYSDHMTRTVKVVSVGNSKGVRIPREILRRQGISDEVDLVETIEGLLLRPKRNDKLSFEEAFAEMAKDQQALAEIREMEGTVGDGLPEDDYS